MILLIDGYNVLKQAFPGSKNVLDKQRAAFINQLAYYKLKKVATITDIVVVFDAGPLLHATREIRGGVVVIFSGQKSSADDWIAQYAEKHRNKDILLISSDRKLGDVCQRYGVKTMPAQEFYAIVRDVLSHDAEYTNEQINQAPDLQKYGPSDYADNDDIPGYDTHTLDQLMVQACDGVPKKDVMESKVTKQQGNAKMLSKHEKKIVGTLKKLR